MVQVGLSGQTLQGLEAPERRSGFPLGRVGATGVLSWRGCGARAPSVGGSRAPALTTFVRSEAPWWRGRSRASGHSRRNRRVTRGGGSSPQTWRHSC